MPTIRLRHAFAAAAAALVVVPASAAADSVRTDYRVTIEGEAFYNRADITPTEWGDQTHQEDEQFRFRTEIQKLSFFDNVAEDATRTLGSATGVRGHLLAVHPTGTRLECDGSNITDYVPGRMDAEWSEGHTLFKLRAFEAVQTAMPCNGGLGDYPKRFDAQGEDLGGWIFDAQFVLPGGSVGQDEIRIPVGGKRTGPACPGHNVETTLCEISWEGEVVFSRIGWEDVPEDGDDLYVPITPEPAPAPADPAAPPAAPTPPATAPLTGTASLSATAVTVPVTCAAGCSGTATVSLLAGRAARAAAAKKPLARKRFTIAPGQTKRITIRIPAGKRRAVRRAGGVRVALAVTPRGGTPTTKRLTVKR